MKKNTFLNIYDKHLSQRLAQDFNFSKDPDPNFMNSAPDHELAYLLRNLLEKSCHEKKNPASRSQQLESWG